MKMLPKGTLLSNPTQPRMGILVHIRHMMHSIKMLPKGTLLSPPPRMGMLVHISDTWCPTWRCKIINAHRVVRNCENTCHQKHGGRLASKCPTWKPHHMQPWHVGCFGDVELCEFDTWRCLGCGSERVGAFSVSQDDIHIPEMFIWCIFVSIYIYMYTCKKTSYNICM